MAHVYQRLKQGITLPNEMVAMAAMTIYEHCTVEERDAVVDKTREAYARTKEQILIGIIVTAIVVNSIVKS